MLLPGMLQQHALAVEWYMVLCPSTIFGAFSENMRRSMDVKDTTIRLSVGLEDVDDLFEDIKQAVECL